VSGVGEQNNQENIVLSEADIFRFEHPHRSLHFLSAIKNSQNNKETQNNKENSRTAQKPILPPGLINHHGDRIGKIQTTIIGPHG
jgi:hypothetical protein